MTFRYLVNEGLERLSTGELGRDHGGAAQGRLCLSGFFADGGFNGCRFG